MEILTQWDNANRSMSFKCAIASDIFATLKITDKNVINYIRDTSSGEKCFHSKSVHK